MAAMVLACDIVVVGAGHAGTEAAWAAARLGADVILVTMAHDGIGRLSCNPAIGGQGKGQMVREIDALGGLMARVTDASGIQYRLLNRSKGPAVWAPRAQVDRDLYPQCVQAFLAACRGLRIVEGLVDDFTVVERDGVQRIAGVTLLDGRRITAQAVILTTGTFMRGLMHCGTDQTRGGRVGEPAAEGLSGRLLALGFELRRLKTGTPPRVHRDSINLDLLEEQPGDDPPQPFSFMVDRIEQPQVCCWIAFTTPATHDIIRANLHRAPMYTGQINATGVRYCPSIEDKVVRFADKTRHQIFLEPEGHRTERVYLNGLGTSLPAEVQEALLRTIPALEAVRVLQPGYAVEYDCLPTHQLTPALETRRVEGLFTAGQINGTSGYEEAAGQGLLAGVNAVRRLSGDAAVVLQRDQAYLGVMIDDLITRPPDEPYRMFTSRAEYRLILRSDNADARLTPLGRAWGLVDDSRWERYTAKAARITELQGWLERVRIDGQSLAQRLRRQDCSWPDVASHLPDDIGAAVPGDVAAQLEISAHYSGYIDRMQRDVARMHKLEACRVPSGFAYDRISALRHEARERFGRVRPATLGQASRLPGITPADITVLWVALEAQQRAGAHPKSR